MLMQVEAAAVTEAPIPALAHMTFCPDCVLATWKLFGVAEWSKADLRRASVNWKRCPTHAALYLASVELDADESETAIHLALQPRTDRQLEVHPAPVTEETRAVLEAIIEAADLDISMPGQDLQGETKADVPALAEPSHHITAVDRAVIADAADSFWSDLERSWRIPLEASIPGATKPLAMIHARARRQQQRDIFTVIQAEHQAEVAEITEFIRHINALTGFSSQAIM